jgi:predicted PurR-regulated permease PerM
MNPPAPSASASRPSQLAVELLPIAVLLGLLVWGVRDVLTPLVVFPLLVYALWPTRAGALGRRTLVVVCLVFALWFVSEIRVVLMPFVLAFAVAYLLAPAVDALVRRRVPRAAAIPMVFLPFLGLMVALALVLVPEMEHQLLDIVAQVPSLIKRVADWALALRTRLVATGGAGFLSEAQLQRLESLQASDLVSMVSGKLDAISQHLSTVALGIGRGVGAGLTVVLTVFGYVIVAPIVVFYLLQVWPNLMPQVKKLVPPAERPAVFAFLKEYDHVLSRFVRGQLTESTLVATLTGVSLGLLGFPGALLMAAIAGLCNLIPTVGTFLGLIPGILIALTAPEVGPALLKLGAVYAVVQIMDGQITGPLIVGGSIGLSPVWSMIAVLVLGALFGLLGMLLSMPIAGLAKMLVVRAVGRYEASPMYTGEPAAPSG